MLQVYKYVVNGPFRLIHYVIEFIFFLRFSNEINLRLLYRDNPKLGNASDVDSEIVVYAKKCDVLNQQLAKYKVCSPFLIALVHFIRSV